MRAVFERRGDALVPVDADAVKLVASVKNGEGISVEARRARNVRLHRKFFALLHFAFDMWEVPPERTFNGHPIAKNFDRFREEVLILAGHYEPVASLDGKIRLEPRSVSFAACDEHEFRGVYENVLTVVWERIFRDAKFRSKEEVEQVTNRLMAYG